MTNTDKMTSRVRRSLNSTYTFKLKQSLTDAQWRWKLIADNNIELLESKLSYSRKSLCVAGIEKIKQAILDGRVVIEEN